MERSPLKRKIRTIGTRLRHRWLKTLILWYAIFSGLWTLIAAVSAFLPVPSPIETILQGILLLVALVLLSGAFALYRSSSRIYLLLELVQIDTTIKIYFGDLFEDRGVKVVAVNEYFDGEVGSAVSRNSLHGQLILRFFNGQSQAFEAAVDRSLSSVQGEGTSLPRNRNTSYPIGTTAVVDQGGERFCLPALSRTDIQTNKASCDLAMFSKAMQGLWKTVRNNAQGEPVAVPLMGSGQAQVSLPAQQLLQLTIMTIVESSKPKITSEIHIVLPDNLMEKIDLDTIDRHWS